MTEENRVIHVDYLSKELGIYKEVNSDHKNYIEQTIDKIKIPPTEPLQSELEHFVHTIIHFEKPKVGVLEATKALFVAMKIKESIQEGTSIYF